jgi:hypothetical protein
VRYNSILLLLLLPAVGYAQEADSIQKQKPFQVIKCSPLHVANFYPSFLMGYERGISRNTSVQMDVGPVFDLTDAYNPRFQRKRGFKWKAEYRYYFDVDNFSDDGHYLALEAYWNFVNFDREFTQTECFDLACQTLFTRDYNFIVKYREEGIAFKFGFFRTNRRMVYEWFFGLRLRLVNYKKPTLPPSAFGLIEDGFFLQIPNETPRTTFGITAGFKLGYRVSPP